MTSVEHGGLIRRLAARTALACVALAIAGLAAEGILRLAFDPVDYLLPELEDDALLRNRVAPNSAGHDAWGYRNTHVPGKADIVTIGDSQTYGIGARASLAWPAQLARRTRRATYNLALGSYGPLEYEQLLQQKSLELRPSAIILGLYLGNDLLDAFNAVYLRPGRESLRHPEVPEEVIRDARDTVVRYSARKRSTKAFGGLRYWLSRHSVLYRVATLSTKTSLTRIEMKYFLPEDKPGHAIARTPGGRVIAGLTPGRRLAALDMESESVREGLRLTCEVLSRMNEFCRQHELTFGVVVIPTKESVYSHTDNGYVFSAPDLVDAVTTNESLARRLVIEHMADEQIPFLDALPHLTRELPNRQPYHGGYDGHPNAVGYGAIAGAIPETWCSVPAETTP